MNKLDAISHYLSYTDFVPVVSFPSGIVHLICAIRDQIFGRAPEISDPKDSPISLASRKLDNWSHCTKGVLALVPLIGNLILLFNWAHRKNDLHKFSSSLSGDSEFKDVPEILKNDRELAIAIIKDPRNNALFPKLPVHLRNDPELIRIAYDNASRISEPFRRTVMYSITNPDILKMDEVTYIEAVRLGIFKFENLDEDRQKNKEYIHAAFLSNPLNYPKNMTFSDETRKKFLTFILSNTDIPLEFYKNYPWDTFSRTPKNFDDVKALLRELENSDGVPAYHS